MHFHRQFCLDPTHGFWFRSQTWILDQIFSSYKFWPNIIAKSCFQKITRQILTTDYRGFMLLGEEQYRTLPDKFWPQIAVDSCFRESSSTEHCQTNSDQILWIHASPRGAVSGPEDFHTNPILTTDCHRFMLLIEEQYRTLPDKLWPQIIANSCFRELERNSTEHCLTNSDHRLSRINAFNPREEQYSTLPDKFWPHIIAESCFWEGSSTDHCQTNSDDKLSWILASERGTVQNIARQILTPDYRGIMLLGEQYRKLPDKFWPQIIADSCFRERNSTEHCQTNSDHRLPRILSFERGAMQNMAR